MRWGVILHGAMMFFAFAINLWDLFDGTNLSNQIDDILKFPFFFLGITFLGALSVGVGLWMKSPPWILTAAIFSMLLFCGSLIVFIKMLITWKHIPEEDKPSWPKIVFLAVQMLEKINLKVKESRRANFEYISWFSKQNSRFWFDFRINLCFKGVSVWITHLIACRTGIYY